MQPEAIKLLQDVLGAADDIRKFTTGKSLAGYKCDEMCRAAVERKFEIIGLRNRLIHGYDSVDDAILWDAITNHLSRLVKQIQAMTP